MPSAAWMRYWWRWSWRWRPGPRPGRSAASTWSMCWGGSPRHCRRRPARAEGEHAAAGRHHGTLRQPARRSPHRHDQSAARRPTMRIVTVGAQKQLRLYGMAGPGLTWSNRAVARIGLDSARGHRAPAAGRNRPTAMRSVSHQNARARVPDAIATLAGFDFEVSPVDRKAGHDIGQHGVRRAGTTWCWWAARHGQDAPGHGHRRGRHHASMANEVRFYLSGDLVNALEQGRPRAGSHASQRACSAWYLVIPG